MFHSKRRSYLPASRFQIIRGIGDPLAKQGISNEFPEITSISFGGFSIQAGGTKMDCNFESNFNPDNIYYIYFILQGR